MPDPTKITIAEWWKYEIRTIKRAWSEIRASIFVRGGAIAMTIGTLTYFGTYWAGFVGKHETTARCFIAACAVIVGIILVCGGEFLFKLLLV